VVRRVYTGTRRRVADIVGTIYAVVADQVNGVVDTGRRYTGIDCTIETVVARVHVLTRVQHSVTTVGRAGDAIVTQCCRRIAGRLRDTALVLALGIATVSLHQVAIITSFARVKVTIGAGVAHAHERNCHRYC
jgi:hypothetical protein